MVHLTPTETIDYSLWKAKKKLKEPQFTQSAIQRRLGDWARSNQEKVHLFASHLSDVFSPHSNNNNKIPEINKTDLKHSAIILTTKEVKDKKKKQKSIWFRSNNRKNDKKKKPDKGIKLFTFKLNAIITTGHFPTEWKIAQIIMLTKRGKIRQKCGIILPHNRTSFISLTVLKTILKKVGTNPTK